MKQIRLELAKMLGFLCMGYWGFLTYNSWFVAFLCAMFGSAVVAISYRIIRRRA